MVTKSDVPAAIAKVRTSSARNGREVAELEEALAHQTRISSALREIGQALGTTTDLDQVLELILVKITEAVDADRATLYLLDDARNELVSRIAQGAEVRSIRLAIGEGIAGHVAKTGRAVTVRDAYKDPRFSPQWDVLSGYRTRSILAAPMKNHLGKTIGVVQVLNKTPRRVHRRRRGHPRGDRDASGDRASTTRASSSRPCRRTCSSSRRRSSSSVACAI